ncbi:MAG TPA: trehalase family glycosidase [Terriglobales bacterium]|nr:trehalase family glycosidase [Terriglobales bacterium]
MRKLAILAALALGLAPAALAGQGRNNRADLKQTLAEVNAAYAKLEPQSIRPAEGFIKYDYLIPAGYYKQMWDWDGFFIGVHLANQSREKAKYLKYWVLNFAGAVDREGYVAGKVTTQGPQQLMGKFAMKPFLAQGAVIASERLGDYSWLAPLWDRLQRVISYREKTQFDPRWGLFFWDNAMQSGADNNVALTNDPDDRGSILAVDLCTYQLREYRAMARLAAKLGKRNNAIEYQRKAQALRSAMLKHLWFEKDEIFFNIRRDTGSPVRRVAYSDFIPLIEDILPPSSARKMIRRYLLAPDEMWSPYGIRSLSKQDPDYNNVSMIKPYSNWQGPVWINANYLDYIILRRYGFDTQASELAGALGRMVLADIKKWGSMHENYNAETGEGLAPTPEQSENHVFTGFVGWDLLVQDMLQCEVNRQCGNLEIPGSR